MKKINITLLTVFAGFLFSNVALAASRRTSGSSTNIWLFISIALGVAALGFLVWTILLNKKLKKSATEISDNKKRIKQMYDNSPDAIFMIDRDGTFLSVNLSMSRFVKTKKADLINDGKTIYDFIALAYKKEMVSNVLQMLSGKIDKCEATIMATDGSMVPVEMIASRLRKNKQKVLQIRARDITQRRNAENKVEETQLLVKEAEALTQKSNQAKDDFFANMSHEIRTPLNGILGMTQLLSDTVLAEDQKECINTILYSTNNLLKTINHVLEISKIESGQIKLQAAPLDLHRFCDKIFFKFQEEADETGLEFNCSCKDEVPAFVKADANYLEQVVTNLLANAFKFTKEGSVFFNIDCKKIQSSHAELHFQIIDTGIGIKKEQQKRLFEKFAQADTSSTREYGGTGLGLSICKELAEVMGSEIKVISSPGQGSTFFFTLKLPLAEAPARRAGDNVSATTIRPDAKILLVEDNLVNQKVCVALLEKAGVDIDTAENGKIAIMMIRRNPDYDVILMDCQMPIMDGFETTAQLRAMRGGVSKTPIVALTAHALADDKQKCLDAGMNDYLSKPVNRKSLITLVNKYVGE